MMVECSAPGKLVLVGEYAVLFGHPALVMAVDRRARVRLHSSEDGHSTVTAPGLQSQPRELTIAGDGSASWRDPSTHLPLVESLLPAAGRYGLLGANLLPFAAELDTRAFFAEDGTGRHKLGLGSSAALTVALASALASWSGSPPPRGRLDWLQVLVELHREAHGGRGSGIDVAASLLGGVVEYRLGERGDVAAAEPAVLPDELQMVFVWTGRSADTGDFLEHLEHCLGRDSGRVEAALARLGTVSGAAVEAVHRRSASAVLGAVDAYWDGLNGLEEAAGLPILSAEHRMARRVALASGATYKPSGAGGGDLGIALTDDPDAAAAFGRDIRAAGLEIMDLSLTATGCRLTSPTGT